MVGEVNSFVTGWVTYYRYAQCKSALAELDAYREKDGGAWPAAHKPPTL